MCVHLNGYVGHLTRSNVLSEVKLTDSSYLTATVADSPWAVLLRQDLESASAAFFVGYSITDLDIRRILFEKPSLKEKCIFALGKAPEAATSRRVERFGALIDLDAADLAAEFKRKVLVFVPPENNAPISYCIRKFEVSETTATLPDRMVFELLLYGAVQPEFVWKSLHGGERYVLPRSVSDQVLNRIKAGARAVVVHSDLGNGKSLLLEEIKQKAHESNYTVYTFAKATESFQEELEWALKSSPRQLFLVDNYPDWLDALKLYAMLAGTTSSLVLTARTSSHDVLVDRLAEIIHVTELPEIPVDHLSPVEVAWLIEYFDEYGLWGERSAQSRMEKTEYLTRLCGSEWNAILLRLFESPLILGKFQTIFEDIRKQRNYCEVLIGVLILTVLGRVLTVDILADMCGPRVLESGFRRDPAIREIVDFTRSEFRLRSSVTGEFILKHIADPHTTVKVLTSLARVADKQSYASPYYYGVLKSLTRFSSLQYLIPEKGRAAAILTYYESIKGLGNCRTNPLFWLQYAIACLVLGDYARAAKYFDASYSYAESKDQYDAYQIDNHYSRFLILNAIHIGDPSKAMPSFREARKIIFEQIQNERLHYPYRVAATFWDFYNFFSNALSVEHKSEILRAAKYISERIEKLPLARQRNRSVVECWEAMQKIMHAGGLASK